MKVRSLILALVLAASAGVQAREAVLTHERVTGGEGCMTEWTPFALTLAGPIGLPCGDWNVKGFQLGLFNSVNELSGLQIGIVNIADRAFGFQIGVINVITTDDVPCLPIVNWSF